MIQINAARRLIAAEQAELDASVELRARMTAVGRAAVIGLKQIEGIMADKGYDRQCVNKGPNYCVTYVCPETGRQIEVVGWHGEVARYGDEKSIMELYDTAHGKKAVINIGVTNDDNINPQNQQRIINEITHYLKREA